MTTQSDVPQDERSVDELYQDYAKPLLRFVRHVAAGYGLSEPLVDAEGIVHETFVEFVCSPSEVRDPEAWLRTVAKRLVAHCVAERRRRVDSDVTDDVEVRWSSITRSADMEDLYEVGRVLEEVERVSPAISGSRCICGTCRAGARTRSRSTSTVRRRR